MENKPVDDRAPMARAIDQATQITTIALTMVVPALPGYWLDTKLNSLPIFTIIGVFLGMAAGLWQLIRFVNRLNKADESAQNSSKAVRKEDQEE